MKQHIFEFSLPVYGYVLIIIIYKNMNGTHLPTIFTKLQLAEPTKSRRSVDLLEHSL